MPTALQHVHALLAYAVDKRARNASDHTAAAQLAWPGTMALPPGLRLAWYGTAGFRLSYQGQVLWIDPYLSRPPARAVVLRRPLPGDGPTIERWVDRADVVLVGHTHFDHAMDVPHIARTHGCPVYGSASAVQLMRLHGLAAQANAVVPHAWYEVGPFRFSFTPSVHSKLVLGWTTPADGELTCETLDALTAGAYRCGQVWGICIEVAGVRFYHQGSADLLDDEIQVGEVDYFLCGIAGRRFTEAYLPRIMRRLAPKVIVPCHYDDFFTPLEAPLGFSLNVGLARFADEVHAASRAPVIAVLPRAGIAPAAANYGK